MFTLFPQEIFALCRDGTSESGYVKYKTGRGLRDNVGNKLILEPHDLILQHQFFLFQPGNLKLVNGAAGTQRVDGIVEIAVFDLQLFKLCAISFVVHIHCYSEGVVNKSPTKKPYAPQAAFLWKTGHAKSDLLVPVRSATLTQNEENDVNNSHMSALRLKHAELEIKLEREETRPLPDAKLVHTLKKQKLHIKDVIAQELAHT
jgi:uncharacterized protein YdcH (DUF465 family)